MNAARASALLLSFLLAAQAGRAAELNLQLGSNRGTVAVRSLLEIRDEKLVRQGWDISCGAAALSTILSYHFGTPYSELAIAVSMLANTDPELVRARGGFSLLDLKRFAEAVGYSAKGYGDLSLDDLANSSVPAILPVRIRGYDHFVVYRGRFAGRVLVGDPAFGNISFPETQLAKIWPSGIGFFVQRVDADIWSGTPLTPEDMNLVVPNLNYVGRLVSSRVAESQTRRPRPTGPLP